MIRVREAIELAYKVVEEELEELREEQGVAGGFGSTGKNK